MFDIVIPVFERPEHTEQTIRSLYKNTKQKFNLVVVNDNSGAETSKLLTRLQMEYKFNLRVNKENIGPGESRNKACASISKRSKYLYFSDNDVYFTHEWDVKLFDIFDIVSKKAVALLGGSCHPYLRSNSIINIGQAKVGIKDAVSGYSMLVTWETYDQFGPFDSQVGLDKKTGQSDDWAFCQRIKTRDEVGSIEPEVVIPTGLSDSYGNVAIGPETFKKQNGVMIV